VSSAALSTASIGSSTFMCIVPPSGTYQLQLTQNSTVAQTFRVQVAITELGSFT
jgi:prophage antirepressor-like protein